MNTQPCVTISAAREFHPGGLWQARLSRDPGTATHANGAAYKNALRLKHLWRVSKIGVFLPCDDAEIRSIYFT